MKPWREVEWCFEKDWRGIGSSKDGRRRRGERVVEEIVKGKRVVEARVEERSVVGGRLVDKTIDERRVVDKMMEGGKDGGRKSDIEKGKKRFVCGCLKPQFFSTIW
jgi:hypothetical protein